MKALLYDCEIIRAIPQRGVECDPSLQWCGGWTDYANMGISVIGFAEFAVNESADLAPGFIIGDCMNGIKLAKELLCPPSCQADIVIGFNSKSFDDRLCVAHGIEVNTHYDVLEEVRIAAFGSPRWQDTPRGRSYALGRLAEVNGLAKTGTGDLAPVLWQTGRQQEVVDYCVNDVKITYEILQLGLAGELIDPNTGKLLKLRELNG